MLRLFGGCSSFAHLFDPSTFFGAPVFGNSPLAAWIASSAVLICRHAANQVTDRQRDALRGNLSGKTNSSYGGTCSLGRLLNPSRTACGPQESSSSRPPHCLERSPDVQNIRRIRFFLQAPYSKALWLGKKKRGKKQLRRTYSWKRMPTNTRARQRAFREKPTAGQVTAFFQHNHTHAKTRTDRHRIGNMKINIGADTPLK